MPVVWLVIQMLINLSAINNYQKIYDGRTLAFSVSMTDHASGKSIFGKRLHTVPYSCECGFEDPILGGDWKTHAETTVHSRHLIYRIQCPYCGETETVELTLDIF